MKEAADRLTVETMVLMAGFDLPVRGGITGELRPTGVRPKLTERLHDAGITLPAELFGPPVGA